MGLAGRRNASSSKTSRFPSIEESWIPAIAGMMNSLQKRRRYRRNRIYSWREKKRGNVKEGIAGKEGTHQLEHTLLRPKILRKPQQIEKAGKVPTPLLFPAKKIVACSDRRNGAKSLRHQHATSNPHNFPTFSAPSADLDFLPPTDLRNSQTARSRGYRRLWASRRRKRYIAHHPRCHLK